MGSFPIKRSGILGLLFCIIALLAMSIFFLPFGRGFIAKAEVSEKSAYQFGNEIPKILSIISTDPKRGEYILTKEYDAQSASIALEKLIGKTLLILALVFLGMAVVISIALYQAVQKPKP